MGPTGVAATNYDGGMTTHSLLGVNPFTEYPIRHITDYMKKAAKKIGKATWLVMDGGKYVPAQGICRDAPNLQCGAAK